MNNQLTKGPSTPLFPISTLPSSPTRTIAMADFLSLSNELIYLIAQPLSLADVYSLLRVNRHLSWLLIPTLYKRAIKIKLKDGRTVLHWAAAHGYFPLAHGLLKAGAKPDEEHIWIHRTKIISSKSTALHYAADSGHPDILELLLEKGADVNTPASMYRDSALHFAVHRGHEKCVEILLEYGADINMRKKEGISALHLAARDGNEALVRLLLDNGADIHAADDSGRQVLHYAVERAQTDIVYLLLVKDADINGGFSKERRGDTPLFKAVYHGHEDLVEVLIAEGADIAIRNGLGRTALHEAATQGLDGVVRLLVECGANVNSRISSRADDSGMTPLFFAAHQGHVGTVRLLVELGAWVNWKDEDGWTALRMAANAMQGDVVRLLMEKGAEGSKGLEWTEFRMKK